MASEDCIGLRRVAYFSEDGCTLIDFQIPFCKGSEGGPSIWAEETTPSTWKKVVKMVKNKVANAALFYLLLEFGSKACQRWPEHGVVELDQVAALLAVHDRGGLGQPRRGHGHLHDLRRRLGLELIALRVNQNAVVNVACRLRLEQILVDDVLEPNTSGDLALDFFGFLLNDLKNYCDYGLEQRRLSSIKASLPIHLACNVNGAHQDLVHVPVLHQVDVGAHHMLEVVPDLALHLVVDLQVVAKVLEPHGGQRVELAKKQGQASRPFGLARLCVQGDAFSRGNYTAQQF